MDFHRNGRITAAGSARCRYLVIPVMTTFYKMIQVCLLLQDIPLRGADSFGEGGCRRRRDY